MKIANWFMNKEFTTDERYIASTTDAQIERETEKAYLLKFKSEFGTLTKWVPKSVCTNEEAEETEAAETINFEIGMTVEHATFGTGTIKAIASLGSDNLLTVKFGKTTKQLVDKFANLKVA